MNPSFQITIDDKFVALELKNRYVKQKLVQYCYVGSPSPSTSPGKTAIKDSSNQQQQYQQLQLKQLLSTILSSELFDPVCTRNSFPICFFYFFDEGGPRRGI
jgi:hypothetical protein